MGTVYQILLFMVLLVLGYNVYLSDKEMRRLKNRVKEARKERERIESKIESDGKA